jgi:hypothetical protein
VDRAATSFLSAVENTLDALDVTDVVSGVVATRLGARLSVVMPPRAAARARAVTRADLEQADAKVRSAPRTLPVVGRIAGLGGSA